MERSTTISLGLLLVTGSAFGQAFSPFDFVIPSGTLSILSCTNPLSLVNLNAGNTNNGAPSHNLEGFAFTTISNITVTSLGRWVVGGNTNTHNLFLYNELDTSNAVVSATLITSGAPTNQFVYTNLASSTNLLAGHRYYMLSAEIDIATPRDSKYAFLSGIVTSYGISNITLASMTAGVPNQAEPDDDGGTSLQINCPN